MGFAEEKLYPWLISESESSNLPISICPFKHAWCNPEAPPSSTKLPLRLLNRSKYESFIFFFCFSHWLLWFFFDFCDFGDFLLLIFVEVIEFYWTLWFFSKSYINMDEVFDELEIIQCSIVPIRITSEFKETLGRPEGLWLRCHHQLLILKNSFNFLYSFLFYRKRIETYTQKVSF